MEVSEMNTMKNSETKWLPDGFHFLGPTESKKRRSLLNDLTSFLVDKEYQEVVIPAMDYSVSFLNQIHPDEMDTVLKSRDLSGREISPGIDLTVQVVKGMAGLSHLTECQNVFYLSKRIRDHKKRNASRREILQLGAESLGSSRPEKILEILQQADELIKLSGLKKKAVLVLGNNSFIRMILDYLNEKGLGQEEIDSLMDMIHIKDSSSVKKWSSENRVDPEDQKLLVELLENQNWKDVQEILKHHSKRMGEEWISRCSDLEKVVNGWELGNPFMDMIIDLSLVRDLKYYTGFLFQGFLEGETEPVLTGGQYDHLFEIFSDEKRPACGFAIHIDSLEQALEV
ncbi:MAG: ATP phosphoribosyltransferase regulatory subunit [Leptospira sp.]|nr:ATP phosphoribosyltransferase regulatory subunit [Leptospira sp.]